MPDKRLSRWQTVRRWEEELRRRLGFSPIPPPPSMPPQPTRFPTAPVTPESFAAREMGPRLRELQRQLHPQPPAPPPPRPEGIESAGQAAWQLAQIPRGFTEQALANLREIITKARREEFPQQPQMPPAGGLARRIGRGIGQFAVPIFPEEGRGGALEAAMMFPPFAAGREIGPVLPAIQKAVGAVREGRAAAGARVAESLVVPGRAEAGFVAWKKDPALIRSGKIVYPEAGKDLSVFDEAIAASRKNARLANQAGLKAEAERFTAEASDMATRREELLRTLMREKGDLENFQGVEQKLFEARAEREGLEELLADPSLKKYRGAVIQVGPKRGELISDEAFIRRYRQGYDEVAAELRYQERALPTDMPDEAFKKDLIRAYRDRGKLAQMGRDIKGLGVERDNILAKYEPKLAGTTKLLPREPVVSPVPGPTLQAGMGIGERPPQGSLFEGLRGEAQAIPLADREALLARQARAAEIARGQAELPIPKAVSPVAPGVAKEPWQMTREEFIRSRVSEEGWKQYQRDLVLRQKGEATTGFAKRWDATHQVAVEDALFKGELVSPEVLADYPDLVARAGRVAPTEAVRPAVPEAAPTIPPSLIEGPPPGVKVAKPAVSPTAEELTTFPKAAEITPPPPGGPPVPGPIPSPAPFERPRPRTLVDLAREARGMRAMTPEQRAATMDMLKPITGDITYKVAPFGEPARTTLLPQGKVRDISLKVPGLRQLEGLWSPEALERLNPVAMIGLRKAIFQEIETGRARIASLEWMHRAEEALGFKQVKGIWTATKVAPVKGVIPKGRLWGTLDDLLENPSKYAPSPKQAQVLKIGEDMQTQLLRDAQRIGVDAVELGEAYWHRIVIKGPKENVAGTWIRGRLGSRKGYTIGRAFNKVDEGWERGFVYETNPLRRLTARLEAGINTIADAEARRQIAQLTGVEKPLERLVRKHPEILERVKVVRGLRDEAKGRVLAKGGDTSENVLALRQAEADYVSAMRDLYQAKGQVSRPGYYELSLPNGRIAPKELVEEVRKYIELPELTQARGGAAQTVSEMSRLLRVTLTTADFAAGFIQGQTLFYRNNIAWWKAQSHALVSLIDDPFAYVAKNFAVMDEGIRMGAISAPTEFLFARQGMASIPTRLPLIGPAARAFNRAFEWFIVVGQTELYKAGRAGVLGKARALGVKEAAMLSEVEKTQLASLGSAIRKGVGTESYAILGVKPNQQAVEALALFAARFFRANAGILTQSLTRGPGGAEARKLMGSLIAGATSLTIGVHWWKTGGMPNIIDPFAPDWMQVPVGRTYFNFLGPFYPYFRTIARASVYLGRGEPGKAMGEIQRFASAKGAIPIRAADIAGQFAFTGKARTFEGEEIEKTPLGLLTGIGEELAVPISVQEVVQGAKEGRPEAALGVVGLTGRGSPYSQMDILFQQSKDINPEGKSFRYAEPHQRQEMEQRFPDIALKMTTQGRGPYGEASRQWEEIDARYFNEELALEQELLSGEITKGTFRDRLSDIQGNRAESKAAINAAFGLFQDERELPEDPNEKALAQYYQAMDKARRPSGIFDWDKSEALIADLEKEWTEAQRAYIERNTNLRLHPPVTTMYYADVKKVKDAGWFDLDKAFGETLPSLSKKLWGEYMDALPEKQFLMEGTPGVKGLLSKFRDFKLKWRVGHEDMETLLIRWEISGVTTPAREQLSKPGRRPPPKWPTPKAPTGARRG